MKILSVTLDTDMAHSLEYKSLQSGKSPESILVDVVARYIRYNGWQQDLLELSIEGLEREDFAGREEIQSTFIRWGISPDPMPENILWSGLGLRAFRKELEHIGKNKPEKATQLVKAVWSATTEACLLQRCFPGMAPNSLEAQLDNGEYCMAFRETDGKRQIIGIIPSM